MFLQGNIPTREKIDKAFQGGDKQYIKLNGMRITDEDMDYITQRDCGLVRQLQLQTNSLTDTGISKLVSAKLNLSSISLFRNTIGSQGCRFITLAPWKSLTKIIISYNQIGDKGAKLIAKGNWAQLRTLCINKCNISDQGLGHLSKATWKQLQNLIVGDNYLQRRCFTKLAKGNWKNLRIIDISWNNVKYEGIVQIFKCDWQCLRQLWLRYNKAPQKKSATKGLATKKFHANNLIST